MVASFRVLRNKKDDGSLCPYELHQSKTNPGGTSCIMTCCPLMKMLVTFGSFRSTIVSLKPKPSTLNEMKTNATIALINHIHYQLAWIKCISKVSSSCCCKGCHTCHSHYLGSWKPWVQSHRLITCPLPTPAIQKMDPTFKLKRCVLMC